MSDKLNLNKNPESSGEPPKEQLTPENAFLHLALDVNRLANVLQSQTKMQAEAFGNALKYLEGIAVELQDLNGFVGGLQDELYEIKDTLNKWGLKNEVLDVSDLDARELKKAEESEGDEPPPAEGEKIV
jgi:hypothetical protein